MLDALKLEQLHKLETDIELQLKENNYDQALSLLLQSLGILNAEDVYDHTVQAFIAANTRTLKRCYFEIALKDFELKEYENARDRIEQALQLVIPPAYLGDTDLKYQFKLTVELTEILLLLDIDEKKELNKIETYRKIIRWQLKLLISYKNDYKINVDIANNNFLIAIKTLSNIKYLDSYSEYPQIRTCLDEVLTIINQIPNPTAEQLDFKSQVFMALKDFHRNIAVQALTKNNFCNAFEHVEYAFKYLDLIGKQENDQELYNACQEILQRQFNLIFEDVPIGFVAYRRSFFYTLSYNPVLKKELNDLLKSARMEPLGEYSNLRRNILTLFDRVRHIVLTYQHVPPHLLNLFVTIDHATGKRTFALEEALEALRKKTFSLFHRTDEDPNTLLSLGNRVIALEETIERQAAVIDKQGALLQQYSEQLAVQTAQLAELKRDMASFKTEKKRSQSSLLFSNNSARTFALKKRYKMYSPTTDNEAERKNAL